MTGNAAILAAHGKRGMLSIVNWELATMATVATMATMATVSRHEVEEVQARAHRLLLAGESVAEDDAGEVAYRVDSDRRTRPAGVADGLVGERCLRP